MYNNEDTIVALATGDTGSIGIIRVSGPDALFHLHTIFKAVAIDCPFDSHYFNYGHIVEPDGSKLDQVLSVFMKSPSTFTGDDVVEIHCHASSYISGRILQLCVNAGCRLALPGEFSYRAFCNGKIDLAQAEAISALVSSGDYLSSQLALRQLDGNLSKKLNAIRDDVFNALSLLETSIDFSDQDIEYIDLSKPLDVLKSISAEISILIDSFRTGHIVKDGIRVVLIGRPNVGKSSLLNALLDEDRAIVSDISGTTRDLLHAETRLSGISFQFTDTAGINDTDDAVESEGIRRALASVESADLVLYLVDPGNTPAPFDDIIEKAISSKSVIVVHTKNDLYLSHSSAPTIPSISNISVSVHNDNSIKKLRDSVLHYFTYTNRELLELETVVFESRHHESLSAAVPHLEKACQLLCQSDSVELVAFELQEALSYIGLITGSTTPDDILENIFSKFCIGK